MPARRTIGVDMGGSKCSPALSIRGLRSITEPSDGHRLDQPTLLDVAVDAVQEARELPGGEWTRSGSGSRR